MTFFDPQRENLATTLTMAYVIFQTTDCIKEFDIPPKVLRNFLFQVSQGYKPNPYHNWGHGFHVLLGAYRMCELLQPPLRCVLCDT